MNFGRRQRGMVQQSDQFQSVHKRKDSPMSRRFAYLSFLLAVTLLSFIFAPMPSGSQPLSVRYSVGRYAISVKCVGRRWSIRQDGFTSKPSEGWVEWR